MGKDYNFNIQTDANKNVLLRKFKILVVNLHVSSSLQLDKTLKNHCIAFFFFIIFWQCNKKKHSKRSLKCFTLKVDITGRISDKNLPLLVIIIILLLLKDE